MNVKFGFLSLLSFCIIALTNCREDDQDEGIGGGTGITVSTTCDDATSTFTINLDPNTCNVTLNETPQLTTSTNTNNDTRTFTSNAIPNHQVGAFPNPGNPNTISAQSFSLSVDLTPQIASSTTSAQGYIVGVLLNGVPIEPYTAEFFRGSSGSTNRDWNITTLTTTVNLGLDCNNAHVQPTGLYHYHGTPSAYLQDLGVDGTEMVKVGYAADGFPIYYKYAYVDDGNTIEAMESGYQLKAGDRGGDGVTAPSGCHDGTYFQDYEYVNGSSQLDACNGRWGKTPESESEYYYIITDNFPSSPLCFSGTPSASSRKGR